MKKTLALMTGLFVLAAINVWATDAVLATNNIAKNIKDMPSWVLMDDTVGRGETWDAELHGYPHVIASSRQDHKINGENKVINGDLNDGWIPKDNAEYPHWLKIDFGQKKIFDQIKIYIDGSSSWPEDLKIETSSDDFDKDIRVVTEAKAVNRDFFVNPIKFKNAKARFVKITFLKGGKTLKINEVEVYEADPRENDKITSPARTDQGAEGFIYANKDNLAFNPHDESDEKTWDPVKNGYPHVTASAYIKPRLTTKISPLPSQVIDGLQDSAHGWTLAYNKWWGSWLKIDFGKETDFQYIKIFSSSMWIYGSERTYIPKTFSIEASSDNFTSDCRQVFSAPPAVVTEAWNYLKDDSKKSIDLKKPVKARYLRFNFPEGQLPNRLFIDEIEVYKNTPPENKIEKVITGKPDLGGKVKAQVLGGNNDYTAWLEGSTRKVFKTDQVIMTEPDNRITVSAAQGERELFQIVITPRKKMTNLRLTVSDLKMRDQPAVMIAGTNITYNPVGYVYISFPFYIPLPDKTCKGQKGDWPDPLLEDNKPINVEELRNYPLWVAINAPDDAAPGVYEGDIRISADNVATECIKLQLKVRNFSIAPKNRHHLFGGNPSFRFIMPYYRFAFNNKYTEKEIAYAFYKTMSAYKFNGLPMHPFPSFATPVAKVIDGKVTIENLKEFDELIHYLVDVLDFKFISLFNSPGMSGLGRDHGYPWGEYAYMSEEYKKYFLGENGFIAQLTKHLEEKGWIDRFYLEIWHEPQAKNCWQEAYNLGQLIKQNNPKIKLYVGGYTLDNHTRALDKMVDELALSLNAIGMYYCEDENLIKLLANKQIVLFSWYNERSVIDQPAVFSRMNAWKMMKMGCSGASHFSLLNPFNPWENPQGNVLGAYSSVGCGDAVCFYPMQNTNSPVPYFHGTIRVMLEEKGWEDYEYFRLLKERIAALEVSKEKTENSAALAKAKEILENAESLINKPTYGIFEYTDDDARKLYAAREQLGEQIEVLGKILGE